jgi:uncharacterized protein with von Willebrand factor type A (vWA) domain
MDVLHKYGQDHKLIFVGDASMSPYEIMMAGGSVEHWNDEAGAIWLARLIHNYPCSAWLNPVKQEPWRYTASISIIQEILGNRMYPLTINGLTQAMDTLKHPVLAN